MTTKPNGKKRGRKSKPHRMADGSYVNGLRKRPSDGRWALADGRVFTEPDEAKAIAKFRAMTDAWPQELGEKPSRSGSAVQSIINGFELCGGVVAGKTPEQRFWAYVARQIAERPKWVAAETGIEQISYLRDLKAPAPLPSFDDLENALLKHARCSSDQRKKVVRAFKDFRENAEAETIDDITPEVVIAYADDVCGRGIGDKQQKHLFTGIRRIFSFAKSRAMAVDEVTKVLGYLQLLKASATMRTLDPKPIERSDWDKLLAAAEDPRDRAMLLLMLNGALYAGEVIRLEWSDIKNGCVVTNREKTGKCIRAFTLWQETIDALAQLPRQGDRLFYSYLGLPLKVCGAQRRYQQVALKAGLAEERVIACGKKVVKCFVTASQLRDGAATAAAAANVNESLCKLHLGHYAGIADHYVKRNPKMVQPACDAVYNEYIAGPAAAMKTAAA